MHSRRVPANNPAVLSHAGRLACSCKAAAAEQQGLTALAVLGVGAVSKQVLMWLWRWGRAGGFANSMLLRQRSSVPLEEEVGPAARGSAGPHAMVVVNAGHDEALKAALVEQAAAVRDITGAALDRGITLREVLKGGALRGQSVFFQSRHGDLLLNGAQPSVQLSHHQHSRRLAFVSRALYFGERLLEELFAMTPAICTFTRIASEALCSLPLSLCEEKSPDKQGMSCSVQGVSQRRGRLRAHASSAARRRLPA